MREYVKRALNRIGRPIGVNPFPRAFGRGFGLPNMHSRDAFEDIFLNNRWGSRSTRSGLGSELGYVTPYRARFVDLLRKWEIKSLFDAPCGDLSWIYDLIRLSGVRYIGGDISPSVVSYCRATYRELDVNVFDITSDSFPEVDLWHCRDCLFHLPFRSIKLALENFIDSNIPYALITSHSAFILHRNLDVEAGGFRYLDLQRPPFSFPRPILRVSDFRRGIDFPRYLCLWTREQLSSVYRSAP